MGWRRNILVVLAHGLRSDAIGDSDAWPFQTPHLQKLTDRSLRLVATSACPADRGGLISLLTGMHARQHGFLDPAPHAKAPLSWPSLLIDAGYHVAGVGCVEPVRAVLHQSILVREPGLPPAADCAYLHHLQARGERDAVLLQRKQRARAGLFEPDRLLIEPDDDIDGFIITQARRVLTSMPEDKPWALLVVFSGPANELPPPTLYDSLVHPDMLETPFAPADFRILDDMAELDYPRIMLQRLEPHRLAQIRADYLGRVSLIDFGVGRLVADLHHRNDSSRTWTVLSSDRGQLLGEHGLVGHRSFLCGAVEVPVIIAPPTPVRHSEPPVGLVSSVDVPATIVDLAGADSLDCMAGRSLLHLLRDSSGMPANRAVVSEFGRRVLLETDRHKVIFDVDSLRVLGLYDMLHDANEQHNLVHTATGKNLIDALRWRLADVLLPLRALPGPDGA